MSSTMQGMGSGRPAGLPSGTEMQPKRLRRNNTEACSQSYFTYPLPCHSGVAGPAVCHGLRVLQLFYCGRKMKLRFRKGGGCLIVWELCLRLWTCSQKDQNISGLHWSHSSMWWATLSWAECLNVVLYTRIEFSTGGSHNPPHKQYSWTH